uniref:Uncharacterized protein n=1 Tax=Anguilla anguilla TaxID=7936 RepID=A0A0E9UAJ3_ANGAN
MLLQSGHHLHFRVLYRNALELTKRSNRGSQNYVELEQAALS